MPTQVLISQQGSVVTQIAGGIALTSVPAGYQMQLLISSRGPVETIAVKLAPTTSVLLALSTGPRGDPGPAGSPGAPGTPASNARQFTGSSTGLQALNTGTSRLPNTFGAALVIASVRIDLASAPVGSRFALDVRKNGASIFATSGRPVILAGQSTGLASVVILPNWLSGEYLTFDVVEVGSSFAGSDLTVTVTTA